MKLTQRESVTNSVCFY